MKKKWVEKCAFLTEIWLGLYLGNHDVKNDFLRFLLLPRFLRF